MKPRTSAGPGRELARARKGKEVGLGREGKRGLKRLGDTQSKPKSWVGAPRTAAGPERALGTGREQLD